MVARDDEHAREHFAAARDMLAFESDRLSNIFAAYLLANTFLMGFLLHAATTGGGFPGEPGTAIVGGLAGISVTLIWSAAYERNIALLDMRLARARETEPDGWELLSGRPQAFDQGDEAQFDGVDTPMRVKGLGRLQIHTAGRLLIALFILLYTTIVVWGVVDAVS